MTELAEIIAKKGAEVDATWGEDPWKTRTPEKMEHYLAGFNAGLEEAAKLADKWGRGDWQLQEQKRKRFEHRDLQTHINCTGRGIAEDIRALKSSPKGEAS
jgi:hypothetical protein